MRNEMTKGRKKSDGRVVPESPRKGVLTAKGQGGKAVTASQQTRQLRMNLGTADSPKGDDARAEAGQPAPTVSAVPKPRSRKRGVAPAMTMEEVANEGTLREAFAQVESNDGAPGPDRQSVEEVARHLQDILPRLIRELLDETYQPGAIRRVWIPKAGGGQRGLGIPDVIDRMVQQAVHLVMQPHYQPTFHPSSHGFQEGKSCHTAIAEARGHLEEGYEWVVDIDLEKFFDRVHHDRLIARLGQKVSDHRLLRLIRRMLKAKVVMPDGVVVATEEGTPQGGPLSPLLSNIVLDELDWELARRGLRFVRYADDFSVFVRSERAGRRGMDSIRKFIEGRLRLKVNEEKSSVSRPNDLTFLGFHLGKTSTGKVSVTPSTRTDERLDTRVRELTPRTWGQSVACCIEKVNSYLRG